jgi:uncharacterized protein YukE
MAYDLSGDKVTLNSVDYSVGIYKTVQNLVSNIQNIADKHNALDSDVENALNDLQSQIDNINESLDVDLDEINAKVTALKEILGEGDTEDQFLDVIDIVNQLVDAINAVKKNDAYSYLFNSDTGEVEVDLSAYGFTSADEYNVLVAMNGDFMAPVTLQVAKVDEKTAKIIARDLRHFAELNVKYTDGAKMDESGNYPNAFPFTILVNYDKILIDKKAPREVTEN